MGEQLNPHDLMTRFSKRLKAAERELEASEKAAKKLAAKDAEMYAERTSLEQQIDGREAALKSLLSDRSDLLGEWSLADFNNDQSAKESIQARRSEIDEKVEQQEQELSTLRTSLDDLGDMSREIAGLVVKLEAIAFGSAYIFGSELRTALIRYESKLNSRRDDARRSLPFVHPNVIEAVREEADEEYAERKQRRELELEQARQYRMRNEQNLKEKATTPYVGWSGFVDQFGEKLPRGSVDADGSVKREFQNKQGTRRAMPKNRAVEVVK